MRHEIAPTNPFDCPRPLGSSLSPNSGTDGSPSPLDRRNGGARFPARGMFAVLLPPPGSARLAVVKPAIKLAVRAPVALLAGALVAWALMAWTGSAMAQ